MDLYNNKMNSYLFHYGINYLSYTYFGCHFTDSQCAFRVWAPNAESVFLVGDFCDWRKGLPMECINDEGVWELVLRNSEVSIGDKYKFKIFGNGEVHYKSDPYAFLSEGYPDFASIIYNIDSGFVWKDSGWLQYRKGTIPKITKKPLNIYEVDISSWKHNTDGSYYSYKQFATELAPYVKRMGYTHIQLVSVAGRDGFCFAVDSRFGSPNDFKSFVDNMHEAGVGVIIQTKGFSVPTDEYGLFRFDGEALYEDKNTGMFDVARNEVSSLLISNIIYWIKEFHIDGFKISGLDSLICCKEQKFNSEAIGFIRKLTSQVKTEYPDVLMIADGFSGRLATTGFANNGLGFDFKWDIGWNKDIVLYSKEDPLFRRHHHEKLTYFATYAFGERYILPITCAVGSNEFSFLNNMSGDYWQKFANVRAFLGYMMTMPGKKHTFMGTEIGQFCDWNSNGELEWFLLDYDSHAKLQRYVSELNNFYLSSKALWSGDENKNSFKWIDPNNRNQNIISYSRIDSRGRELIVVINFSPVVHEAYKLGVSTKGEYIEVFNSDDIRFGGSGVVNFEAISTESVSCNYLPYTVNLRIPPLGMVVLKHK